MKKTHEYLRLGARVRRGDEFHFLTGWAPTRRSGHHLNQFDHDHRLYRRPFLKKCKP